MTADTNDASATKALEDTHAVQTEEEVVQYYTKDGQHRGYKVVRPDGSIGAASSFGVYEATQSPPATMDD